MEEYINQIENSNDFIFQDLREGMNHAACVSNLAYNLGAKLDLPRETCYDLAVAGMLHDLGKIEVCEYLNEKKVDALRIEQMQYIRTHSTIGYLLLKDRDYSEFVLNSILYHHENYDGSGYPAGLAGDRIPLGARILRVCDVFAALISARPYRAAFSAEVALDMMADEYMNYDMRIFLAFQSMICERENMEIFEDRKIFE